MLMDVSQIDSALDIFNECLFLRIGLWHLKRDAWAGLSSFMSLCKWRTCTMGSNSAVTTLLMALVTCWISSGIPPTACRSAGGNPPQKRICIWSDPLALPWRQMLRRAYRKCLLVCLITVLFFSCFRLMVCTIDHWTVHSYSFWIHHQQPLVRLLKAFLNLIHWSKLFEILIFVVEALQRNHFLWL